MLLFHLYNKLDISRAEDVFLQYMICKLELDELDKELGRVTLRGKTSD